MKKANKILLLSAFLLTFIVTKQLNVMQDTEEIWKDITSYIGCYQISRNGDVKSLTQTVKCKGGYRVRNEKLLKPLIHSSGYLKVQLGKDAIITNLYIHRIVATSFVENPYNHPHVNHINKIKTDNRAENLEWVNCRENNTHCHIGNKKSRYVGVYWYKPTKKWVAQIGINGKRVRLGYYINEEGARDAYKKALVEHGLQNRYA